MASKATETKKPLFKAGEIVYYQNGSKFEQATVDQDQPSRMAKVIWIYYNRPDERNPHKFKAYLPQIFRPAEYEAIKDQPAVALYKKGDILTLTEDGETYPVKCERDQISGASDRLYVSGYHIENTWVDIAKLSPAEEAVAEEAVAEEAVAEEAVAEEAVAEEAVAEEAVAEEAVAEEAVAEKAVAKPVKKLFQKGDRVYLKTAGEYVSVMVTISQRHSKSKKIEVLKNGRKVDALVKDLISAAKYQEITGNTAPIESTVADAPARLYKAGDWCYWQARPGDEPHNKRIVKCDHNQHKGDQTVWVIELKGNWRDRFGVNQDLLSLITDPAKIAELEANDTAIEARVDEMRQQEGLEAKAAREQALLAGEQAAAETEVEALANTAEAETTEVAVEEETEAAVADVIPTEAAVADVIPTEAAVADVIPTEAAVADVIPTEAAVAGDPECYPDGIRRDSAIGRLRAEADRALAAMWKQNDQAWYKVGENNYNRAEVYRDQKAVTSKKVQITHWRPKQPKGIGPVWVLIADLLTDEQYSEQQQAEAKKRIAALAPVQNEETPAESEAVAFTSPQDFAKQVLAAGSNAGAISRLCDRLLALPRFDPANINERTKMTRLGEYSRALEAEIKASGLELVRDTNAVIWRKKDGSEQLRHYYYKLVGLMDYDWDADNRKAAEKVIAKLDNQVANISSAQYIETTEYLLLKTDSISILGGLIAATGRRIIELATLGEFTEIEGKTDQVMFSGQAKKRNKPSDPYAIYLIGCTAKQFLVKLDFVRTSETMQEARKGLSQDDPEYLKKLSGRLQVQVNRKAIGPAFDWLPSRSGETQATGKTLRSTWAAVVTGKYCPPETNPLLFTSRLLGHFNGSVESMADTLNYIDSVAAKSETSLDKVSDLVEALDAESDAQSEPETTIEDTIEDLAETEEQTALALDYVQFVADEAGDRHKLDFYETPAWASLAMLEFGGITGTIGECCNGFGAISRVFSKAGFTVWTNDVDSSKPADYHIDVTVAEYWESLPDADWIVSNPPYGKLSAPIVINAFKKAKKGVAMVLKMNWWELCQDRKQFLKDHPPTGFINLPRYCYRKGTATGKWATDEAPTVIYLWDKSITHGLTKTIPLPAEDLRLFHRTPDETPALEKIEAHIAEIMAKKSQPVEAVKVEPMAKTEAGEAVSAPRASRKQKEVKPRKPRLTMEEKLALISEKMEVFLKKNAQLDKLDRWFVSQNIIAKVAGVGNDLANEWLNRHKPELSVYNEGLNRSEQNRGRVFSGLD